MDELRTDYKDQLLDTSVNTERKFNLVDSDGNVIVSGVSLKDITQYSQTGDTFGAADINKITAKINEQNNSLTNENSETFNFGVKDGVRGFFTNPSRADDSFIPFSNSVYGDENDIVWMNPNCTQYSIEITSFSAQTISIDLSNYKTILVATYGMASTDGCTLNHNMLNYTLIPIDGTAYPVSSKPFNADSNVTHASDCRLVTATSSGVTFKNNAGGYTIPVFIAAYTWTIGDIKTYTGNKLLWENSSPTSAYANGNLEIDLSGYNTIGILTLGRTNEGSSYTNANVSLCVIPVDGTRYAIATSNNTGLATASSSRNVVALKDKIVFFKGAQYVNGNLGSGNRFAVPLRIIGLNFKVPDYLKKLNS